MRLWKWLQAALVRLGIAGLIIAFIAGIVAAAYFAAVFPDWTGFGPPLLDVQGKELPHAKTLWDWLGLLLVPLVLAVGGYFLTRSENRYALQIQERREEEARKLEMARAQDTALQGYLDQMTELLLHEKLRTSQPDDEVRSVARARTLTALRVLDGARKATVLQFLYEANLVGKETEDGQPTAIVDLRGVDLRGSDLRRVFLYRANLRGTDLSGANLDEADLHKADLTSANLNLANLNLANLNLANLDGADLREVCLCGASLREAYLRGANLKLANLRGTNLRGANLKLAKLGGADLRGADLRGADLLGCEITREQLTHVFSVEGAKLPFDMAPPAPVVEATADQRPKTSHREN